MPEFQINANISLKRPKIEARRTCKHIVIGDHVYTLEYDKESIEHASNNPNGDWI